MKTTLITITLGLLLTPSLQAAEKYLIKMPGPKPAIAKSFKDLGHNKYEFTIDPKKKIKGVSKLSFKTLEKSLTKKKIIKSVTGDVNKIVVTYTGNTEKFLKKVSRTRIKDSLNLALESSVSDGTIRARTASRRPKDGEVKAKVIAIHDTYIEVMAQLKAEKGVPDSFPLMRPIKVKSPAKKIKLGETIFFSPTKLEKDVWQTAPNN